MTSIVWFRRDLRLHDHPALLTAHRDGPVLPLVVLDPALLASTAPRVAGYLACVRALGESIAERGSRLIVRMGAPAEVVPAVAREAGASRVHISAESEPYGRARDEAVRSALAAQGAELVATGSPYAVKPGVLRTRQGTPFRVFTPFSRAWRDSEVLAPAPLPDVSWAGGVDGEDLPLVPQTTIELPRLGEDAALERWAEFCDGELERYGTERDRPDLDSTSRMSVHLKYGTIHPRTLVAGLREHPRGREESAQRFLTELIWREFYADVLWHRPDAEWADLRLQMQAMEHDDPETDPVAAERLQAWKDGRTGYPIVDAGMRQLLATGWMHNRVRMIVGSFLTKDLHIWWPHGARHFLDHLLDGDVASNNHGWQWVAGTGTDASPYFRVFNPLTQGAKFDPRGEYVRRWVPELRDVGPDVHDLAAVAWAPDYPAPIVDHAEERREALRRYGAVG